MQPPYPLIVPCDWTGYVKTNVFLTLYSIIASVGFRLKAFILCSISGWHQQFPLWLPLQIQVPAKLPKWYTGRLSLFPGKFSGCVIRYLSWSETASQILGTEGANMGMHLALLGILGKILVPCSVLAVELMPAVSAFFHEIYVPRMDVNDGNGFGVLDSKRIDCFRPQVDVGKGVWRTACITEARDLLNIRIIKPGANVLVDALEAACFQKASQYNVDLGTSY